MMDSADRSILRAVATIPRENDDLRAEIAALKANPDLSSFPHAQAHLARLERQLKNREKNRDALG